MDCAFVTNGLRVKFYKKENQLYARSKPCCHLTNNIIQEQSFPVDSYEDLLQNKSLQYYRNWFSAHKKLHHDCESCLSGENNNNVSPRIKSIERYNKKFRIYKFDLDIGNKCNLACPFCNPNSSSLIEKITKKVEVAPYNWNSSNWKNKNELYELASFEDYQDVVFDFCNNVSIQKFKIIGGEPLIPQNWKYIKTLLSKLNPSTEIEITTNGTYINEEIINTLEKYDVLLRLSIDSIGKNYEFIRWPAKWNTIEKNLKKLKESKIKKIILIPLLTILNYDFKEEIENKFTEIGLRYNFSTFIKPESSPYSISNLNTEIGKEKIRKEINFFLKQRNMNAQEVLGKSIIKIL